MDKVSKLKLFHDFENSQGIQVVVNTGTSTLASAYLTTIVLYLTFSPTQSIEIFASAS